MLIETQIAQTIRALNPEQLADAVESARRAMRQTRDEFHEHVSLQDVAGMSGCQIRYCVRGLGSHIEKEYIYNYETGELFAFNANSSHLDINRILFLALEDGDTGLNHGF